MKTTEENRQELWIASYLAYMNRDYGIPSITDAEEWANKALKAFDKNFKQNES